MSRRDPTGTVTEQAPAAPVVPWAEDIRVYHDGVRTWFADAIVVLTEQVKGRMPLVRIIERHYLVEDEWAIYTATNIEILSPPEDLATPEEAYAMADAIRGAGERLAAILALQVVADGWRASGRSERR